VHLFGNLSGVDEIICLSTLLNWVRLMQGKNLNGYEFRVLKIIKLIKQ